MRPFRVTGANARWSSRAGTSDRPMHRGRAIASIGDLHSHPDRSRGFEVKSSCTSRPRSRPVAISVSMTRLPRSVAPSSILSRRRPRSLAYRECSRSGETVDAGVVGVPRVTPDPIEPHVSSAIPHQTEQTLPQVSVLDPAARSLPRAVKQPPLVPVLVEALLDVRAVRANLDCTAKHLQCLADRGELHAVVRRAVSAAGDFAERPSPLNQRSPPTPAAYPLHVAAAIGP